MRCSILGCGWLGLPLANYLVQQGVSVKGSSTRDEKLEFLAEQNIDPFKICLYPDRIEGNLDDFLDTDVLILNFPPGRRSQDVTATFPETMSRLIDRIEAANLKRVLFISSTSVYGNPPEKVTEESPPSPPMEGSRALLTVEEMLGNHEFETTILRISGLVGYNRKPGRFLAGRRDLSAGDAPVNLLHRDDCVRAIWEIIRQEKWNDTFNVCADQHPTRREFYTYAAQTQGLPLPHFLPNSAHGGKWVSNDKLKHLLNFEFVYPDPFQMVEA